MEKDRNQQKNEIDNPDLAGMAREDQALRRFKEAVSELITLLRTSLGVPTVYLYWINRHREQFVLESSSTSLRGVVFQDRTSFDDHFLNGFREITEAEIVETGEEFPVSLLPHHVGEPDVKSLIIFPFVNKDETIALTVAESNEDGNPSDQDLEAAEAYQQALGNILKTYLELSELLGEEDRWQNFQSTAESYTERLSVQELLVKLTNDTAGLTQNGGAALLTRGIGSWHVLYESGKSGRGVRTGMRMTENAQANRALRSGKPEFSLHFNGNPKRVGNGEPFFEGASLSVPLTIHDRRQGVLVVWDENAMAFRESLKYMIADLARISGLQLSQARYGIGATEDFSTGETEAYTREFLESALDNALKQPSGEEAGLHLVFISIKDYQNLRTSHRLESLKQMQRELAHDLNPNNAGTPGLVSFYADSQFLVLVHSGKSGLDKWLKEFYDIVQSKQGQGRVYISGLDFYVGIHKIDVRDISAYDHIQAAKQQFNRAVKEENTLKKQLNG